METELGTMWTIGAIISGIVCASQAAKKSRNEFACLRIGFAIGIFGLMLFYLLEPLPVAGQGAHTPAPTSEKKCPMCAETVKAEAKLCRLSGHKFEALIDKSTD